MAFSSQVSASVVFFSLWSSVISRLDLLNEGDGMEQGRTVGARDGSNGARYKW